MSEITTFRDGIADDLKPSSTTIDDIDIAKRLTEYSTGTVNITGE